MNMKSFLKKFFFWDDPAAGAVFSWILSFVSTFCFSNFHLLNRFFFSVSKGDRLFNSPVVLVTMIIQLLLAVYCLFLSIAFFFRQDKSEYKKFFWYITVAIAVLLFYFWSISDDNNKLAIVILAASLIFSGYNALCVRKRNFRWYIALLVCGTACWPGVMVLFDVSQCLDCHSYKLFFPVAVDWRIQIAYSAVLFYIAFMLSNFKLWASANNKRLRDVWGIGCNVLLIVLAISYLSVVAAALFQQKKCKTALNALENNFQRKISAGALKEIYYRNRKADENFHIALKKAWNEFDREEQLWNQIISESAQLDKLPEQYRNKFFSAEADKIGKFFDAPLPARERNYSSGTLMSMMLPDLQIMRQTARLFAWQIRIACENKDYPKAILAWKRSAAIREYLKHDTSLIAILVMIAVDNIRLDSLEQLLASNMLRDDDLQDIQSFLCHSVKRMPEIKRDVLYFEAVLGSDAVYGLANGSMIGDTENAGAEGIKHYRFLAPGIWYLANRNYYNLLSRYNVESIDKVDKKIEYSPENLLAAMIMPQFKTSADRLMEMEMRYQAFNALIEAEKIKRKTGKYPEKLPLNITDYFSGKPLLYKIGKHQKRERFLKKEKHPVGAIEQGYYYSTEYRTKTVYGVAVWSVGRNKTNNEGLYGTSDEYGERIDDPRALLIIQQ
jgi:NADH:ubiquinone oxidoreductase subunit 6 (subunit J)